MRLGIPTIEEYNVQRQGSFGGQLREHRRKGGHSEDGLAEQVVRLARDEETAILALIEKRRNELDQKIAGVEQRLAESSKQNAENLRTFTGNERQERTHPERLL